ncbi:MAG: DUF1294 domain-containing protein [Lachnospiraceae bacterium]|nr:DUF1294 domain-containing protein [Lachnospiraceae bacterium]
MYQTLLFILLIYLVLINLIGFFMMLTDKRRAGKNAWRIPEKTLFLTALAGGSAGIWGGMYTFHHKTRHWYFVLGVPLILILQLALAVWISFRFF